MCLLFRVVQADCYFKLRSNQPIPPRKPLVVEEYTVPVETASRLCSKAEGLASLRNVEGKARFACYKLQAWQVSSEVRSIEQGADVLRVSGGVETEITILFSSTFVVFSNSG